jgi:hypothetical protein
MKNIIKYKIQALAFLFMFTGLVFLPGCEEEEEPGEVVLLSFGPSGVHHGDEIIFVGQNLDKVTAIVFQPSVEVSTFVDQTSGRITVVVPEDAEAGKVILKAPSGDVESMTILNFEVPVVLSSITEEAKPGSTITITGDKLNWIEEITFPSDIVVTKEDFESLTLTELVVTVPLNAQTGYLLFATGGTEPLTFGSEEQLIVTVPTVTGLAPSSIRHTGELTISGTDLDLITEVTFSGDNASVLKANFVSQSATTIVLTVPATTESGVLTLKQESPVNVMTSALTIILPAGTSVSPSPANPGVDDITITGTNLDLVGKIVLPGAGEIPSSSFITHTATQIKLAVPGAATQGAIGYVTIHDFAGPLGVILKLPSTGGFPALDYYIYKDGLEAGWQAYGGWGHVSQSYTNGDNPANGDLAIKTVFNDAYGAIQIKNNNAATVFNGYNYLVFYVYVAGEESDIIVQIGDNADYYPAHFTGDKYHQIVVPLASLAGANNVTELRLKNNNSDAPTNNTTVYIDEIGLTIDEPLGLLPDLSVTIFDDVLQSPFGQGGGWGGSTTDAANIENQRGGEVSIKATFGGSYSGAAQFGTWGNTPLSTGGMQYVAFSIFGGAGTDGKNVIVNVRPTPDGSDVQVQVAVEEGKWKDVQIPLSSFGSPAGIGMISFQDTDWSGTVFIDHIGLQ